MMVRFLARGWPGLCQGVMICATAHCLQYCGCWTLKYQARAEIEDVTRPNPRTWSIKYSIYGEARPAMVRNVIACFSVGVRRWGDKILLLSSNFWPICQPPVNFKRSVGNTNNILISDDLQTRPIIPGQPRSWILEVAPSKGPGQTSQNIRIRGGKNILQSVFYRWLNHRWQLLAFVSKALINSQLPTKCINSCKS